MCVREEGFICILKIDPREGGRWVAKEGDGWVAKEGDGWLRWESGG